MRRAILATTGTVAGLVAVLGYSPPDAQVTGDLAAASGALGAGFGPLPSVSPAATPDRPAGRSAGREAAATRARKATPTASPTPPAAAPTPSAAPRPPARTGTATPRATPRPTPKPTATPKPTPKPAATPKPTPTPVPTRTVNGTSVSFVWGELQVAIKVSNGRIIDAWAVTCPQGHSQLFSDQAIPVLRSETISAQSADIASVSGASGTSAAWKQSLAAAIAGAGL